jgi:hypothetical protein
MAIFLDKIKHLKKHVKMLAQILQKFSPDRNKRFHTF